MFPIYMRYSALLISFQRPREKGKVHIDFKRIMIKSGTIVIVRAGEHTQGGEPYSVSVGWECVRWYLKKNS